MAALDTLRREISEQPEVVARVVERQQRAARELAPLLSDASAVVLVARGSSDHAAVYGRYLFETRNRLLTSLAAPSTVTLYGAGPRLEKAVVIAVSQSGRGADLVAYVEEARRQGAITVAIVNDPGSPVAAAAQHVLDCQAGSEVSVPATKTVLAQMTVFALLSFALSGDDASAAFANVPDAVAQAIAAGPDAQRIAARLAPLEAVSIVGRGLAYPVALELALKLKETSDTRAEPFSAADFLHGPVTLLDAQHGAIVVDVGAQTTAPALDTARRVHQRGAPALLLRAGAVQPLDDGPWTLERHSEVHDALAPLVGVALGQQLALELALAKGLDPATPRGLEKITITR